MAFRILDLAARLLLALGVGCLLLAGYLGWRTLSFSADAIPATGEVVSYREIPDGNSTRYVPRIRFVTEGILLRQLIQDPQLRSVSGQSSGYPAWAPQVSLSLNSYVGQSKRGKHPAGADGDGDISVCSAGEASTGAVLSLLYRIQGRFFLVRGGVQAPRMLCEPVRLDRWSGSE